MREAIPEQIGRPLGLDVVEAAHGIFRHRQREHGQRDPPRLLARRASIRATSAWSCTAATARSTRRRRPRSSASASCWCRRPRRPSPRSACCSPTTSSTRCAPTSRRSSRASRSSASTSCSPRWRSEAERELRAAGLARGDLEFRRFVNLCYPGQTFDMAVPRARATGRMSAGELAATVEALPRPARGAAHLRVARRGAGPARRARADGRPHREAAARASSRAPRSRRSSARCARGGRPTSADASWTRRSTTARASAPATRIDGPAIIEEPFTTIVIHPARRRELDRFGNYQITL